MMLLPAIALVLAALRRAVPRQEPSAVEEAARLAAERERIRALWRDP